MKRSRIRLEETENSPRRAVLKCLSLWARRRSGAAEVSTTIREWEMDL